MGHLSPTGSILDIGNHIHQLLANRRELFLDYMIELFMSFNIRILNLGQVWSLSRWCNKQKQADIVPSQ